MRSVLGRRPDPARERRSRLDDAIVTLEVFDNDSGKTMFVLPVVLKGFNPQPEPPAPVQSLEAHGPSRHPVRHRA